MTALLIAILILIVISLAFNVMILAALGDVLAWLISLNTAPFSGNVDARGLSAETVQEAARNAVAEAVDASRAQSGRIPKYDA